MNFDFKRLLRDVIVAILSAILTFFTTSCAFGMVCGHSNKQTQEVNSSLDSTSFSSPLLHIK